MVNDLSNRLEKSIGLDKVIAARSRIRLARAGTDPLEYQKALEAMPEAWNYLALRTTTVIFGSTLVLGTIFTLSHL